MRNDPAKSTPYDQASIFTSHLSTTLSQQLPPPSKQLPTMAIISSTLLLRTLSIFHLTTAYYLLTTPPKIADQNLVFILGAAMSIVYPLPSLPPSIQLNAPQLTISPARSTSLPLYSLPCPRPGSSLSNPPFHLRPHSHESR